jgi:hypothetical protein
LTPPILPAFVAHADWGASASKRVVAAAVLRGDTYVARAPRLVGGAGGLLERMHVTPGRGRPALLGFDFPIGLPRAYAKRAGIEDFSGWLRGLDAAGEFFDVSDDVAEVSLARPFFPRRIAQPSPGIKHEFRAALGLSASELLRRCDLAHCRRRAASEMFWALGPQAVGRATLTGWRELVAPALGDPARRYALWPFDGELGDLLAGSDAVIVEAYPADAYLQLGLRMGSRGTAKTWQEDRRADGPLLLERSRQLRVRPDRALAAQIRDGFGSDRAGEDRFDATVGLLAMIATLRRRTEPDVPDDPCIRRVEGWVFGRHAPCPPRADRDARSRILKDGPLQ